MFERRIFLSYSTNLFKNKPYFQHFKVVTELKNNCTDLKITFKYFKNVFFRLIVETKTFKIKKHVT